MRATTVAARSALAVLQVGLQSRRRAIAGGVRCRSHHVVAAGRGRCRATHAHVHGQRTALLEILEVARVTRNAVGSGQINTGRHGHCSLARRGGCVRRAMVGHEVAFRPGL